MPGVWIIKGWNRWAGRFTEEVVAADAPEDAKARAIEYGLTLVEVRPYAAPAQDPPAADAGPPAGPKPPP